MAYMTDTYPPFHGEPDETQVSDDHTLDDNV
jgi:hypothetical protein